MSIVCDAHPDIKFLKDHKLMNDLPITYLIKRRALFLQKSPTNEVTKEECLKLLKLEVIAMEVCQNEIQKNDISNEPYSCDRMLILNAMSNQIDHLYYFIFQKFSMECKLLKQYMEFRAENEAYITNGTPQLIVLMTKKVCEPHMYITAATFEYKNKNIEKARKFLEEGIKNFPLNKNLYVEQIWIESLNLKDTSGESEDIAIQIYNNIKEKVEMDMEFHFQLLYTSIETNSIWQLQYHIVCDLMEKYKQSEVMWRRLATLASQGYIFEYEISFFRYTRKLKERASSCIETYVEGLKNLKDMNEKRNLMELLTEYIINIWKVINGMKNMEIHALVRRKIDKTFQIGHFELGGLHKSEYYVYWAVITGGKRPEIVQLAIDLNKDDVEVWVEVMEYHILNFDNNYTAVKKIFEDGIRSLENKSLPLWDMMEMFLHQKGDLSLIHKLYYEGAKSPYEEVNMVYRLHLLTWHYLFGDIFTARSMFNLLKNKGPECKKLYMYMIHCELCEEQVNVNQVHNLYEIACSKFGQQNDDASLWIECMEFELTFVGEKYAKIILDAALKMTKPKLWDDLKLAYNSMVEDHRRRNAYNRYPSDFELSDEEE